MFYVAHSANRQPRTIESAENCTLFVLAPVPAAGHQSANAQKSAGTLEMPPLRGGPLSGFGQPSLVKISLKNIC